MLSDEKVDEIRRGLADGMRGPVLLKWLELLLGTGTNWSLGCAR